MAMPTQQSVLLVGGTGRTGRLVLDQLLGRGVNVRAIVRPGRRLPPDVAGNPNLTVIEASLLALPDEDLQRALRGCDAVISCLGHVLSLAGVFGPPRDLVTRATSRLCGGIGVLQPPAPVKYILMSSVSVNRAGSLDTRRGSVERALLRMLCRVLPPADDNQRAADFLQEKLGASNPFVQWTVVRPDSLLPGDISEYTLHEGLVNGLLAPGSTNMANIAHFMCELVTDPKTWADWQAKLPVIINAAAASETSSKPVRHQPSSPRTGTLLAMLVLLAVLGLPILACQGAARDGSGPAGAGNSSAVPLRSAVPRDSAGVPLVPILSRYEVLAVYDVLPVGSDRADYSGITVVGADSSRVILWLADDKALRLEDAIYGLRLDLPKGPRDQVTSLEPARIKVRNEHGIPTGDDIEDIGWLPPTATAPGLLAASGERGPGDAPVSWLYLLVAEGQGLRLSRSGNASPPGEAVENDGMEGVALRRAAGDRVELYVFKERPAPSYARLFVLEPDGLGDRLVPDSSRALISMPAFQTQAGAAFRPGGEIVSVIDRQRRLIGMMEPFLDRPGLESKPREWLNYDAIDSLLEGRDSGASPSLYGVLEGIAEDTFGRLYLLADNNEVRHSRLVVLRSTKP